MTTVLCVEDEPQIRAEIVDELNDCGYMTIEAANGKEGVEAVLEHKPNLVLCDINMPVMSGFEMLDALRENHPEFDGIPFVFLSALADRNDVVRGKMMGGDDYITKPIDFIDLLSTLESRLSQVTRIEARNEVEKEEMRQAILRNLPHELRTPLNHIIGFCELLLDESMGPLENERYGEYIKDIHASGCNLLDIVSHAIDLIEIVSGCLLPAKDKCDIAALLRECMENAGELAGQDDIQLVGDFHEPIPHIQTDETLLKRAVSVVLTNAIQFSKTGELVRIEARFSPGDEICITIADTGAGIADDDAPRVFTAFEQADTTLTRKHQGAGLGLTVAKAVMEALGGGIDLHSKLGEGTTVDLYFPAGPGSA